MLIRKRFIMNERTRTISFFIDKFKRYIPPLSYKSIEFFTAVQGKIKKQDSSLLVYIPYKNYFFKANDKRGMKILTLKYIFMIQSTLAFKGYPKFLAELDAYRKIIKNGFTEDLYYYFFMKLMKKNKQIKTLNEYIDINIPWLSFYKFDDYLCNFFASFAKKFKSKYSIKKGTKIIHLLKDYETTAEKINRLWKRYADN